MTNRPSSADGNSDFFSFSTGRRAVKSLHTTFTLRPRHDLFQLVYQFVRGLIELDYKVYDSVELEFTFREPADKDTAVPGCVWAVVAKDEMKQMRTDRWDLVRSLAGSRCARDLITHIFGDSRSPRLLTILRFPRPSRSCLVRMPAHLSSHLSSQPARRVRRYH